MESLKSKEIICLYIDDSGTRVPDRNPLQKSQPNWFALGGILFDEKNEEILRKTYHSFCNKWNITHPLHSVEIRHKTKNFSWLKLDPKENEFYDSLNNMMLQFPVIGHACVIHKPGYHERYYTKYGRERWQLCKTAFSVICERVAKIARKDDKRVRIFVEESDKKTDQWIKEYFKELKENGMPFSKNTSEIYEPMSAEELNFRLLDLKFKRKTSIPMQIADLYLYPICRGKYQADYFPYTEMQQHKKLIDCNLEQHEREILGIKYSCFDYLA